MANFKISIIGKAILLVGLLVAISACNKVPTAFTDSKDTLSLFPDYTGCYIPYNIAPMNFEIDNEASSYLTQVSSLKGAPLIVRGRKVQLNLKDWKRLLNENRGNDLFIDVYAKVHGGWQKFPRIVNHIAEEPIDQYTVYRYLQPLYTAYEDMSINQRDLENFDVRVLFDNRAYSTDGDPHCINCHSFQNYNKSGNMQLHVRGENGGTVIVCDNQHKKVNPKAKGLKSNTVYPAWHPTLNLIAYSTNTIGQNFHSKNSDKVEVLDSKSDLILYDVEKNTVMKITDTKEWLETFPYWNPKGDALYYAAAWFKTRQDTSETEIESETISKYDRIRYDIVRRPFDRSKRTFGAADTIFSASSLGKSATFPRLSPDGHYLLFTMGDYGNFHIWHKSSNLYLMDLRTRKLMDVDQLNSPDVESYHSWSSNGRWIIFSSRREDGAYTRLYIAYFDKNGHAWKPFIVPQKDPHFYKRSFKSFNIPEFIIKPAATDRHHLFETAIKEPEVATLLN